MTCASGVILHLVKQHPCSAHSTTCSYIGYGILFLFGHLRDFLRYAGLDRSKLAREHPKMKVRWMRWLGLDWCGLQVSESGMWLLDTTLRVGPVILAPPLATMAVYHVAASS